MIRPVMPDDLQYLFQINMQSTPGVSDETWSDFQAIVELSTAFVATGEDNQPRGFITLVAPGEAGYASPNLRWFEARQAATGHRIIYVDRIAISPLYRGQKIGEALYRAAFDAFAGYDEVGCEVNTKPNNPGSHRFHMALGFERVGKQRFEQTHKAVAYYVKPLAIRQA